MEDIDCFSLGDDELLVECEDKVRQVGSVSPVQFQQITQKHVLSADKLLDWKFSSGAFLDLITYDPSSSVYSFNQQVTGHLVKYGKRVSLLGVYNQSDTLLGFTRDCQFNLMDYLVKCPPSPSNSSNNKAKNIITCISLFEQPIYNRYDQSYLFIVHLHHLSNNSMQQKCLSLLNKISATILLNIAKPEQLKEFSRCLQEESSLSPPALIVLTHGYTYSQYMKNEEQMDMQGHFLSTIVNRLPQQTQQTLNTLFRKVKAYNLPQVGNITNLLKEIRLQVLLLQRVKYVNGHQMFSSNILSYYLDQCVTSMNKKSSSGSDKIDLAGIVDKYYKDIVEYAYEQAMEAYNGILDNFLCDDSPKLYPDIYNIIKSCRVSAMEKYLQISEEAQDTSVFKEKKEVLLSAIKQKEIGTLQINEQLSDQHCQFVHDKIQTEKTFNTYQQKQSDVEDMLKQNPKYFKDGKYSDVMDMFKQNPEYFNDGKYSDLVDIFIQNAKYFNEAKGVKIQQQFLDLHQKEIAAFLVNYLKENQHLMTSVENVIEKRISQIDGQLLNDNQKFKNELVNMQKQQNLLKEEIQKVTNQREQAKNNFIRQKTVFNAKNEQSSEQRNYLDQVSKIEAQIKELQNKNQNQEKKRIQHQQKEQEIDRLSKVNEKLMEEIKQLTGNKQK